MTSVLFYTVGSRVQGFGHVQRSITLANELRERGVTVSFATEHETPGVDRIRNAGYHPNDFAPGGYAWIHPAADVIVVDLQGGPGEGMLTAIQEQAPNSKLVAVGGVGYGLSGSTLGDTVDLEVYQSVLADKKPSEKVLSGIEYVMVRPEYTESNASADGHIAVYLGRGGYSDLTDKVVNALVTIERPIRYVSAMPTVIPLGGEKDNATCMNMPASFVPLLDGASLYVGAMGMCVYEALAAGVPCVVLSLTSDHERTAEALPVTNLGLMKNFDAGAMLDSVKATLSDWASPERIVDGQGVVRVADKVLGLLESKSARRRKQAPRKPRPTLTVKDEGVRVIPQERENSDT